MERAEGEFGCRRVAGARDRIEARDRREGIREEAGQPHRQNFPSRPNPYSPILACRCDRIRHRSGPSRRSRERWCRQGDTGAKTGTCRDQKGFVAGKRGFCAGGAWGAGAGCGHRWRAPYAKLAEYLEALADAPLSAPPPDALGPLYLAAHGPLLQRLARARADGIVTYLMPVEHARQSRARLGDVPELNVVIPCLAETDPEQARAVIRRHLRHYVGLDYYQREWGRLGLADQDFQDGGSDRLVDAIAAWGDRAALEARVQACADAGATRVVIMPLDAQHEGTLGESTLAALAPSRPK